MLPSIKGIGQWTAHVALCDWLADWSSYPFEDLAVRTWAGKRWHAVPWPQDKRQFAALWQEINGVYTGIITFSLLSYAATRQAPQPSVQEVLF
jgi:DNA-3-methyladenine glycosylase II